MRPGGILALVLVAVVAVSALVFAVGTLALTAVDYLSQSGPAPTIEDADLGTLEVYDVLENATLDPLPSGLGATVWSTYVRIVGAEYAGATMNSFQTGHNSDSDLLAWVIRAEGDVHRWDLAANLAQFSRHSSEDHADLIATLVHEYAHILSLNADEIAPFAKVCDTLKLEEGCAEDDSYLFAFEREFWVEYGEDAPDATNVDDDVTEAFYADHEEDFVSAYAATNVVEDFAESFMLFVIEPEPDNDETLTARKLLFFSDYPELVEIRDRIRTEFEGEL